MVEYKSFFDVGLSDLLGAYSSVEREKLAYSLNANKQSQAQKEAIAEAEKTTQAADTKTVSDYGRAATKGFLDGIDKTTLYILGSLAALGLFYIVAK